MFSFTILLAKLSSMLTLLYKVLYIDKFDDLPNI